MDPARVADVPRALEAARLAHQLGDLRLSARWLTRAEQLAARNEPAALVRVELERAKLARNAGRIITCREHVARALRADPASADVRERAAELLQSFGDLDGAAACLSDASPHPNVVLRYASIAVSSGKTAEARDALQRIAKEMQHSAPVLISAGNIFLAIVDVDRARECFTMAVERDRQCIQAHVALAFLALHHGQTDVAVQLAERAVEIDPNDPRARLVLLASKLFRGDDPSGLLLDFDAVIEKMPSNSEALALRARARRGAGDARGALEDLLRAKHSGSEAQNYLLDLEIVALGRQFWGFLTIEDLTAMAKTPNNEAQFGTYWPFAHRALTKIEPPMAKAIWLLPDFALQRLAERIGDRFREEEGELAAPKSLRLRLLERLSPDELLRATHGNRSPSSTYVDPTTAKLAPLELRRSARHRAKTAQWAILHSSPEDVLRSFDVIARDHPRSHHPFAYRGEVLLWLGRYDEASDDFQKGLAVNPRARWLHIGMGAVQSLQGKLDDAMKSFQRSVECAPLLVGPTLLAYRGEALRLAGKPEEAVRDLETACRDNPSRISAWVNLWLANDDLGHAGERDAVFAELMTKSRFLLADAAEERFSKAVYDIQSAAERRLLLEHVLCMMRGNRSSSCVTYFTRGGELRSVMSAA